MDARWREICAPRRIIKKKELRGVIADFFFNGAMTSVERGDGGRESIVSTRSSMTIAKDVEIFGRRPSDEFDRATPRGLCRVDVDRLLALGCSRSVVDECGRRFWRSSSGADEVTVPTSVVGWLTHAAAQYAASGTDANARADARGKCVTTRVIEPGEAITVDIDAFMGDVRTSGGWVGARATPASRDERGDDLLRWLASAPPCGLRTTSDGDVGVFALDAISVGTVVDVSLKRVDEIVRGRRIVGETPHGKLAEALATHGDRGAMALHRVQKRFSFSHTYQTFPLVASLDEVTTLSAMRHSDDPNLVPANGSATARFKATRDIGAGEELTVNREVVCVLEVPGTGGFRAFYEHNVKGEEPPWAQAGAGRRSRGGLDYSKWDNICSSSESDGD